MGFSRQEYWSGVFAGYFLNSDMVTRQGPAPDLNKGKGQTGLGLPKQSSWGDASAWTILLTI